MESTFSMEKFPRFAAGFRRKDQDACDYIFEVVFLFEVVFIFGLINIIFLFRFIFIFEVIQFMKLFSFLVYFQFRGCPLKSSIFIIQSKRATAQKRGWNQPQILFVLSDVVTLYDDTQY